MRDITKLFVRKISEIFDPPQPVVEIGSFQVPGQEEYADLRPFFPNKLYIGIDMCSGFGIDVIADGEQLPFKDASVGTIIILDTLEHVKLPLKVSENIARVLKPDGIVIVTSVMNFPIHDYPNDYWRFTPEGLKFLLQEFPIRIIGAQGPERHPHSIFGIGLKSKNNKRIDTEFQELRSQFLLRAQFIPPMPEVSHPNKATSLVKWFIRLSRYYTGRKKVATISNLHGVYLELFLEPVVGVNKQPLTGD